MLKSAVVVLQFVNEVDIGTRKMFRGSGLYFRVLSGILLKGKNGRKQ